MLWHGGLSRPRRPADDPARGKKKVDRRRRLFIRAGVATAIGAVILAYGVGFLFREQQPTSPAPVGSDNPTLMTSQAITPTADFYRVDVNIFPPSVNAGNYLLALRPCEHPDQAFARPDRGDVGGGAV